MNAGLVDLSLFTVSPTNDQRFALNEPLGDSTPSFSALGQPSRSPRHNAAPKPLPPILQRRMGAMDDTSRSNICNPARTVLERVKRIRIDPCGVSPDSLLSPPSRLRQQQTLQERRNPGSMTPTLTIPTSQPSAGRGPSSAAAVTTPRPAAPMIWLADEEMWLVADTVEAQQDLYGFYAPAPHTDPGPYGHYGPDSFADASSIEDVPPAYTPSPASPPSPSDFSPVRSQFSNLLQARSRTEANRPGTATPELRPPRDDRTALSPMFQEAISGMSFGLPYESASPAWAKNSGRRDSCQSDSGVSPLSSSTDNTAETPSRGSIHRTLSARH